LFSALAKLAGFRKAYDLHSSMIW